MNDELSTMNDESSTMDDEPSTMIVGGNRPFSRKNYPIGSISSFQHKLMPR